MTAPRTRLPLAPRWRVRWWLQALRSVRISAADEALVHDLWRLYARHRPIDRLGFEEGLAGADRVWVCRDPQGEVRAFGVVRHVDLRLDGALHRVLCLAQAAVDPGLRGTGVLTVALARSWLGNRVAHPRAHLYAALGACTLTGYLLMARAFPTYWPRVGTPNPQTIQRLVEHVARDLGYPAVDPATGIVHGSGETAYRLGVVAEAPVALQDDAVAAYARLNPGQARGDALLCVAPLALGDVLSALRAAGSGNLEHPG